MAQDGQIPDKKDLTGIMELPQAEIVKAEDGSTPQEFSELMPVEQIDDFASLDQVGMMDHPMIDEGMLETPLVSEEPPTEDPESSLSIEPGTIESPALEATPEFEDPFLMVQPPEPLSTPEAPLPEPARVMDQIKTYSESKQEAPFEPGTRDEFHLQIQGDFDPYSRDKLLLFLTENALGISSSELDFQIKAHRVLLPRISEFSGIKLIQDLRDSGLSFVLKKAASGDTEPHSNPTPFVRTHFQNETIAPIEPELPILSTGGFSNTEYQVLDSIQMVQYLRAEILEVEKSDLFQDLIDRMTEALRKRAKLKGAHALTQLKHSITPLRLPSQYQIEMSASLLKRL